MRAFAGQIGPAGVCGNNTRLSKSIVQFRGTAATQYRDGILFVYTSTASGGCGGVITCVRKENIYDIDVSALYGCVCVLVLAK